jgi:uncharacterized protein (TIGR03435 family)
MRLAILMATGCLQTLGMTGLAQNSEVPQQTNRDVAKLSVFVAQVVPSAAEKESSMDAGASPTFLVAAIRPSDPNPTKPGWSFESEGHHITCRNATLNDIVGMAYGIHTKQVVGAPEWFSKLRFDINGVPDLPGVPNFKQEQHMYQELLADRFHLVSHRETREIPIYAITVSKGGPILTPADPKETLTNTGSSGGSGFRTLKFTNVSMADLALNLSFYEDRPVIDQTSVSGRYNFTLKWTYDVSMENEAGMPPSLFTAVKEQIGLRMDAVKGPPRCLSSITSSGPRKIRIQEQTDRRSPQATRTRSPPSAEEPLTALVGLL